MEAFILAAGLGTRLKPITDSVPKALVKINGTPLLQLVMQKLISNGVSRAIINIHHHGGQIISFLNENNNFGIEVAISDERNLLLDTGGGLRKAAPLFSEDSFLIHNVDILSGIDIKSFMHYHNSGNSIATLAVQKRESSRYFLFDSKKILCGWENVMTGEKIIVRDSVGNLDKFAFSGIHAIKKELLSLLPQKEVFSIVEAYLSIAEREQITYFDHTDTVFIDLGKINNLKEAENILLKTDR